MDRLFPPYLQRYALRVLFGACAFLWTQLARPSHNPLYLNILIIVFLIYATIVFGWELGWRGLRPEHMVFSVVDFVFVGGLISLTGGAVSEMQLLLYFVVAMRAPYRSWVHAFMIPGAATVVDIAAVGPTFRDTHWSDFLVRILLLWFLAMTLRVIGLRSVTEKQKSEKLARELSTTHDEVKRYTAALEKANDEKEKRLAELTLLHRFVIEVRSLEEYDQVYDSVFQCVHSVCDPAWLFFLHKRSADAAEIVTRAYGNPPGYVSDWILGQGIDLGSERDGARSSRRFRQRDDIESWHFIRGVEEGASFALVLAFPVKQAVILKAQVEVLSALMDTVEMELELLRLRQDLARSNRELSESNAHLTRLHELQHELNRTFLVSGDVSMVIQGAHEIMAKDMFELDRLNLFLPDEEREVLQCHTSVGIGDFPQDQIWVPADERGGAISKSFREGRTILFDGNGPVPEELRLAHPFSEIPAIRSRIFVIVPLIDHRGKVIGVIGADRKNSLRPIPADTVTMLEFFARHVAMVLSVSGLNSVGDT